MIKYCNETHDKGPVVDTAPTRADVPSYPAMMRDVRTSTAPSSIPPMTWSHSSRLASSGATDGMYSRPHMHIAAIDNSLSFPHEHPKGWRSFTYGWLYLPVSLIGRWVVFSICSSFEMLSVVQAVLRTNAKTLPPTAVFERMVGRDCIRAQKAFCSRSRLPSKNVRASACGYKRSSVERCAITQAPRRRASRANSAGEGAGMGRGDRGGRRLQLC